MVLLFTSGVHNLCVNGTAFLLYLQIRGASELFHSVGTVTRWRARTKAKVIISQKLFTYSGIQNELPSHVSGR